MQWPRAQAATTSSHSSVIARHSGIEVSAGGCREGTPSQFSHTLPSVENCQGCCTRTARKSGESSGRSGCPGGSCQVGVARVPPRQPGPTRRSWPLLSRKHRSPSPRPFHSDPGQVHKESVLGKRRIQVGYSHELTHYKGPDASKTRGRMKVNCGGRGESKAQNFGLSGGGRSVPTKILNTHPTDTPDRNTTPQHNTAHNTTFHHITTTTTHHSTQRVVPHRVGGLGAKVWAPNGPGLFKLKYGVGQTWFGQSWRWARSSLVRAKSGHCLRLCIKHELCLSVDKLKEEKTTTRKERCCCL